jgi:uncharacterized cupredoxin-like copper-binding protein
MRRLDAVLMSATLSSAILPAAAAAAAAAPVAHPAAPGTAVVKVKLSDFKIAPSKSSVKAGRVTFVATNDSPAGHELVVIKTRLKAAKLPISNAVADQKGAVGELPDVEPNRTQRLTLTLAPGHYALICNVTGHYAAGMHVDFTVT